MPGSVSRWLGEEEGKDGRGREERGKRGKGEGRGIGVNAGTSFSPLRALSSIRGRLFNIPYQHVVAMIGM